MKIHRFYVESGLEGANSSMQLFIPSLGLLHQMRDVLRFPMHTIVSIFDGSGPEFRASIEEYRPDGVSFNILEKLENNVIAPRETWLFASIIKKDNFEWIVEKATELGISHIVPVISDRTEKQGLNRNRLTKVSIEAAEQSGRATVPEIHDILELADALANYSMQGAVAWEPTGEKFDKKEMNTIVSTFIGPEGGWTPAELEMFKKHDILIRSLGPQILRAETAVIAALSQVVF